MHTLFSRFRSVAFLALLCAGTLASCDKEDEDTTDYAAQDETTIQTYIADKKLTGFQRQPSGLYVAITQPGTGALAKSGDTLATKYTGTFLNGQVFDSNTATVGTFKFTLNKGQVIAAWDEGFQLLNKGAKATFLVPSGLGYGKDGAGPIAPNTVLRFDVELRTINNK